MEKRENSELFVLPGESIREIYEKSIPGIKINLKLVVKKVRYIESDPNDHLSRYRNILYKMMEEIEENILGPAWINSMCPDIFSKEGEDWLNKSVRFWMPSFQYDQNVLREICEEFIPKAGLIDALHGWIKRIEDGTMGEIGYMSHLQEEQIEKLYPLINGKYFNCQPESLKAMLGAEKFPTNLEKPIWIYYWGSEPNKAALRDFLKLAGCRSFGKYEKLELILDKNQDAISLTNSKQSMEYDEFRRIFAKI
jgi:hypothetical protein